MVLLKFESLVSSSVLLSAMVGFGSISQQSPFRNSVPPPSLEIVTVAAAELAVICEISPVVRGGMVVVCGSGDAEPESSLEQLKTNSETTKKTKIDFIALVFKPY